jgi:putative ABC transport system substrate-binding protein
MDGRRRSLIAAGLASLVAGNLRAAAPAGRTLIVGYIAAGTERDAKPFREFFEVALRQRGYVEGRNIAYEWRFADQQAERLDNLAAELVARRVDVIVAAGTPPTLAAHKATTRIPIICMAGANPMHFGLASSLARPGGNVTGVILGETYTKGMEVLRKLVPGARRVGWVMNPDNPANLTSSERLETLGKEFGVKLVGLPFRGPADLERELGGKRRTRVDALFIRRDAKLNVNAAKIAEFALAHRIPTMGVGVPQFVPAGGLASFHESSPEMWGNVAEYVDRIANGASAAELPIMQPTKFELFLNRKTARALGLTIPPDLLVRADLVVE